MSGFAGRCLIAFLFCGFAGKVQGAGCTFDPPDELGDFIKSETVSPDGKYTAYKIFETNGPESPHLWAHAPKLVFFSNETCKILKAINLTDSEYEESVNFRPKAGAIIILSSSWEIYDNGKYDRYNDISIYNYSSLNPLVHRRFKNKSAAMPGVYMAMDDAAKKFYVVDHGVNAVNTIDMESGIPLGQVRADPEYLESVKLGRLHNMGVSEDLRMRLEKQGAWHDFKDQITVFVFGDLAEGEEKVVHFSVTGEPLHAAWIEDKKTIHAGPAEYEKRFGVKLKPLPYIPWPETEQGEILPPFEELPIPGQTRVPASMDAAPAPQAGSPPASPAKSATTAPR